MIQHYVKQFLTWAITSISQRLHPGSWLQDDVGISRHDALDNDYFCGGIIVVAERYGMIEVSSYPCLYLMDGSWFRWCWNLGVVLFDALSYRDSSMLPPWLWEHSHPMWDLGIILCIAFDWAILNVLLHYPHSLMKSMEICHGKSSSVLLISHKSTPTECR